MNTNPHVLQISHTYGPPFTECARHYAELFRGTKITPVTVFIVGEYDKSVDGTIYGEVLFLGFKRHELRGLKINIIKEIKKIFYNKYFIFCIAHRSKPTWIACLSTNLFIFSIHHAYGDYHNLKKRFFINFFSKRILMVGVSRSVSADLKKSLKSWPNDKIIHFYNRVDLKTIDATMLERNEARHKLGLNINDSLFVNLARLHNDKDQVTLIKGFYKSLTNIPLDTKLILIGRDCTGGQIKHLVESLGLTDRVVFFDFVQDAFKYLRAFDAFILSSSEETFGLVLVEAMAADLPIICSRCGGAEEVVGDYASMFDVGDDKALSELITLQRTGKLKKPDIHLVRSHIEENFTDDAARRVFWSLESVKKVTPEEFLPK